MKENEDIGREGPKGEETVEERGQLQELPEEEIARLRSELEAKIKEADYNYNMYLRACADLENYKKRAEREKADAINFANEKLIEEVLPVIDNFERALAFASGGENLESLRGGVQLTVEQMYSLIKKFGLQEIKSVGEKFDPSLHHAILEEESGAGPGVVIKEFQKGYLLKGRLLRPAMVAVSKAPENDPANSGQGRGNA